MGRAAGVARMVAERTRSARGPLENMMIGRSWLEEVWWNEYEV
jgi:hypothetical protein